MLKQLATIRALLSGKASIERITKVQIKKAPGETTELTHQ